jgi:hypothetical protein
MKPGVSPRTLGIGIGVTMPLSVLLGTQLDHLSAREVALLPPVIAILIFFFQLLNSSYRGKKEWTKRELQNALVEELGQGILIGISGGVVLVAGPSPVWQLVGGIGLIFPTLFYPDLEVAIRETLAFVGLRGGTERFGDTPVPWLGISLREMAGDEQRVQFPPYNVLAAALTAPAPGQISPTRRAIGMILPALCISMILIGALGIMDKLLSSHTTNTMRHTVSHTHRDRAAPRARARTHEHVGPRPSNSLPGKAGTWHHYCYSSPGAHGPAWATQDIYDEYLGGRGPGALDAGCTGLVYQPPWANGRFAYTIGTFSHHPAPMSVGVDSPRFGPAIFLAPATSDVLAMINNGQIIGGSPRGDAGSGQYYAVYGSFGTKMLIRTETHPPGRPTGITLYEQLPPAVASAWFYAMENLAGGQWLWPRRPKHGPGQLEIFELARLGFGASYVARVVYDLQMGHAKLVMEGDAIPFDRGIYISDADLKSLARTAR